MAASPNGDKPTIHATASLLDSEAKPEPFVYTTKRNARLTFPDPLEMEWEEAETFIQELLGGGTSTSEGLQKWLGPEQFTKLKSDRLTYRQLISLMNKLRTHYFAILGTPGEDPASASS